MVIHVDFNRVRSLGPGRPPHPCESLLNLLVTIEYHLGFLRQRLLLSKIGVLSGQTLVCSRSEFP
jgi:hypothetical protein